MSCDSLSQTEVQLWDWKLLNGMPTGTPLLLTRWHTDSHDNEQRR